MSEAGGAAGWGTHNSGARPCWGMEQACGRGRWGIAGEVVAGILYNAYYGPGTILMLHTVTVYSSQQSCEAGTIITSILEMRALSPRQVMPKVTQLINGRAGIQTRVVWFQRLCSPLTTFLYSMI